MIIHTYQKSKKKKKLNAKQRALKESWEDLLKKYEPKKPVKISGAGSYQSSKPYVRETPKYPSLNSFSGSCTKPVQGKVYTGTAMIGIGTLHKSNAVPIFNVEDAQEQAKMRR